jgi:Leucine-rich repeat (LRR) protein
MIYPFMFFSSLNNNGLEIIEGRMFGDGSSIRRWLLLNNNDITQIPDDAFQGASVRYINLDNNKMTVFPGTALGALSGLEIVYVT